MIKFGKLFVEQKLLKKGCKNYKPSPQGQVEIFCVKKREALPLRPIYSY
jgi:hypothetical protein